MNHLGRNSQVWFLILLASIGFVFSGLALLPYPGIQADEALVAAPILGPVPPQFRIRIFHRDIPLMLMDYVGAPKSWLFSPIFALTIPSPESLRLPALLLGALTIGLFCGLLHRIAGPRAALAGAFLLATDSIFLLTTEFDWGPVAIQHLLLVSACLFLLQFARTNSWKPLAAGFFALGLGIWDKATFAWILGGLLAATAIIFPREILPRCNPRNLAVALAAFLLGVWPLVAFNVRHDWRTFRNTAALDAQGFSEKAQVLLATLDGSGLFSYMLSEQPPPQTNEPEGRLERASLRLADFARQPHKNLLAPALLISLVSGMLLQRTRRATLFAITFMATAWLLMALTKNAGGAVHHAVLLWPFPELVIAIVLAETSRRRAGIAIFAVTLSLLCVTNLLVTNQYLAEFIRNGPSITWTDAIYPLSNSVRTEPGDIYAMDWDIFNPLLLLNGGHLNLHAEFDSRSLASQRAVFITHTPGNEFFPAPAKRLESEAAAAGYRKELLRVISDSHGHAVFQVYQFVRQ